MGQIVYFYLGIRKNKKFLYRYSFWDLYWDTGGGNNSFKSRLTCQNSNFFRAKVVLRHALAIFTKK